MKILFNHKYLTINKFIIAIIILLLVNYTYTQTNANCNGYTSWSTLHCGNTNCSSCNPGYYLVYYSFPCNSTTDSLFNCSDTCHIANCITCNANLSACNTCDTNYVYSSVAHTCLTCASMYDTNCLTCNTSSCTSCNNIAGYYLNSSSANKQCASCNFYKCQNCTDGPICSACEAGYFLNTSIHLCMPCYFPCLTCNTSATSCVTCVNDTLHYFRNPTCVLCNDTLTACLRCDSTGANCTQCNSTLYYVSTNMCTLCTPPCKNCLSQTACYDCVDYTTVYNTINMTCDNCSVYMPGCTQCITSTVCLICNVTPLLFLSYPPNSCVTCQGYDINCVTCTQTAQGPICQTCKPKFYIDANHCVKCPVQCQNCTSSTVCGGCVSQSYIYQNSSTCTPCYLGLPNCILCSNQTTCLNCTNNTLPDMGTCKACANGTFSDYSQQKCIPCASPCINCQSSTNCLSCQLYYNYLQKSKKCQDICGDFVVKTDQCDNGQNIANDGCSNKCRQSQNYNCTLYIDTDPVTNLSVNRSICSYLLSVDIQLYKIQKNSFLNKMIIIYSLIPYLYGLPGTTNQVYTQDQLKQIFNLAVSLKNRRLQQNYEQTNKNRILQSPLFQIDMITCNPSNNEINIEITYYQQIKSSQLMLTMNTTYLTSLLATKSLFPNNFYSTPPSMLVVQTQMYQNGNTLAGAFYEQNEYSYAKLINYSCLIIALLSFVAFIVGIFTKQVAGLQMAMLCQFVYISLFYYKGTMELPYLSLKSLLYSTGYNVPNENVVTSSTTPPQSFVMQYNPQTFFDNFNLMAILYILPLIAIIPFIPIKAKCIRKLNIIEIGHKWVDLLLGEISLFVVLFNFQFFLFSLIVYYQNGTNVQNYASTMMIIIGSLVTLCSFIGIIFRPQIYGNFRTVFKYNTELSSESLEERDKKRSYQDDLTQKFEGERKCDKCIKLFEKVKVFINDNYFYKRWRPFHTALTYNHYNLVIIFFTLSTLSLTLIQKSELIILSLSSLMLLQLIVLRPYGEISEKLRAIYFFMIITYTSIMKYMNNQIFKGQLNFILPLIMVFFLAVALLWTYIQLISYFSQYIKALASDRNKVVGKIFQDTNNINSKDVHMEEQEVLMRKLMKKYERIQLQYDVNGARNQLLDAYNAPKLEQQLEINPTTTNEMVPEDTLKKMSQQNKFKDLKQVIQRQKKKKKKQQIKNRVAGSKMLKLLNLDNFSKYEDKFLLQQQSPTKSAKQFSKQQQQQQQQQILQKDQNDLIQTLTQKQEQESTISKDSYVSIQPTNLEQAQQKMKQQNIIIQENQHLRYQRAVKVISNLGLELNKDLISDNYPYI